jgi:hypothetical protein
MRAGRPEFERAIREYAFDEVALDPDALAAARETLRATGLLVVGEPHGVLQTPAVVYALICALGIRAVAFEWSHEELDDLDRLWTLPATAEAFCGDGRVTAGHFALLERTRLDQVIAFDRLDATPPASWEEHVRVREPELAARLLAEWDRQLPLLVLTGAFHAQLTSADGVPMAAFLARDLPGLQPAMLAYRGIEMPPAPIVFNLPTAQPAVTPEQTAT